MLGPRHLGWILDFDAFFYGYKSIPLIMISPTKYPKTLKKKKKLTVVR